MATPTPAADPPPRQPLWRDLATGSAGVATKIIVTLALAGLLTGLALVSSFFLAAAVPQWNYSGYYGGTGVYPRDELLAWLFTVASAVFLAAAVWLWSRNTTKHRAVWYAAIVTIGVGGATAVTCLVVDSTLGNSGDAEYVIGGVICLGASAVLLVWLQAFRRYAGAPPLRNVQDGRVDLRCPSCGYRMVDLHESRCPECGVAYTLDELFGQQDITRHAAGRAPAAAPAASAPPGPTRPPPLPPPDRDGNGLVAPEAQHQPRPTETANP